MIIEQCFKLLDALLKFGYYQSMLFFRFGKQITRAIIILYPIVVMNFPSFRDRPIMGLLPYKDVFSNISFLAGTRMERLPKPDITLSTNGSTAFPHWVFFWRSCFQILYHTSLAHLCCFVHFPATLRAYFRIMFRVIQAVYSSSFFSFITSIIPSYRIKPTLFSASWTKLLDGISPLKILSTVFTFEIYHHSYNFTINQCRSQVYMGR